MERTKEPQNKYALEIFSSDAYFTINKNLLRYYGPDVAIFLSNLIDKYKYFLNKDLLIEDKWFFLTNEHQIEQTGLTIIKLQNCKNILRKDNIIKTTRKGLPAKEYYAINFNNLLETILGEQVYKDPCEQVYKDHSGLLNNNKIQKNYNKKSEKNDDPIQLDFPIVPSDFIQFWNLYPKKPDKGKALTAWNKLCHKPPKQRPTWKQIKLALIRQKKSDRWQDPKFIPHPTTWLNQSRWFDDPKEMKTFTKEDENNICEYSGTFGKDFSYSRTGCMECEDKSSATWRRCKLAHAQYK